MAMKDMQDDEDFIDIDADQDVQGLIASPDRVESVESERKC